MTQDDIVSGRWSLEKHARPFVQHPEIPKALRVIRATGLVFLEQARDRLSVEKRLQRRMEREQPVRQQKRTVLK